MTDVAEDDIESNYITNGSYYGGGGQGIPTLNRGILITQEKDSN